MSSTADLTSLPIQEFSSKIPAFSVIVPARNAVETLGETLDGIARSSRCPAEVIVVNDGSNDLTAMVAASYPCQIAHVSIRKGPMQARFAGAQEATSPILVFVDADVRVRPDTFEQLLRHFQQENVHAVTGILACRSERENFFSAFKNEYMNFVFKKQPSNSRFLYGSLWAIRRDCLIEFKPISWPFGSLVSDSELGILLRRRQKKIVLDHGLELEHLKHYTFWRLLKNDIAIPFLFAVMLFKYGWSPSARKTGRFSHASFGQVLANTLAFGAVFSLAAFLNHPQLAWLGLAIFCAAGVFVYWQNFLGGLLRSRGRKFFARAAAFLPLDGAVMFCGMAAGFFYGAMHWIQRRLGRLIYTHRLKYSDL